MLLNCPQIKLWHRDVPKSPALPTALGLAVLLVWGVGFGLWAALAPLSGAVVASGSFVATGQNKLVQHLEGGIVQDILVKEGDRVEPGHKLVRFDDTTAKVKVRRLEVRYNRLLAMRARLFSEILLRDHIEFPDQLNAVAGEPEIAEILERQRNELTARRNRSRTEVEVLKKEIAGLQESLEGYQSVVNSTKSQIKLFEEELTGKNELMRLALIRKPEVLALQRSKIRLDGEYGQLLSRMGDTRERIARANQQIASIDTKTLQTAFEDLRGTDSELDDVKEQLRAARDVLTRIVLLAPVRGIVVKLNHNTKGGVVPAGATLLELLPTSEELVLEARVMPNDILHVREGQDALVKLNALNQRRTPMIDGKVVYVSADALGEIDPRKLSAQPGSGLNSFVVRLKLDGVDLDEKVKGFQPTPGMPAEIYIKTGDRTFFQYLLKPIVDSFTRAFREQ